MLNESYIVEVEAVVEYVVWYFLQRIPRAPANRASDDTHSFIWSVGNAIFPVEKVIIFTIGLKQVEQHKCKGTFRGECFERQVFSRPARS
jgi:hypothetical protein